MTSIKGRDRALARRGGRDRGGGRARSRSSAGSSPRRSAWRTRTRRSTSTSSVAPPGAWEPGPILSNSFGFGGHNGCLVLAPVSPEHPTAGVVDLGEFRRRARRRPPDCAFAGFSDHPPGLIDPHDLPWLVGIDAIRTRTRAEVPSLVRRSANATGSPHRECGLDARPRGRRLVPRRPRTRTRHDRAPGFPGGSGSRSASSGRHTSSSARSSPPGEGIFPPEIVSRIQACFATTSRRSHSTIVRRIVEAELGRPLEGIFAEFDPDADRRRLDRPGPRRPAPHRRAGGRQGAASRRRRRSCASDLAGMSFFAPFLVGRIPVAGARQPAGANRAVRRDDRRGARLPPRGREHARRRAASSPRPTSGRSSSPAPIHGS